MVAGQRPAPIDGETFERLGEHEGPEKVCGGVHGPRLSEAVLVREALRHAPTAVVPHLHAPLDEAGHLAIVSSRGSIWAQLAARLPDLRCLLLDRPGTGLSDPKPMADPASVRHESETLVADVLDAMDLSQAHLVGSSHGSYVALLSAAAHPERVGRTVHLGCPGFIEGMNLTAVDRLVLLPGARHLFSLARPSEKNLRKTFRSLGHGTTLDRGGLSPAFLDWCLALQRETDTMGNEFQSMASMGTFRAGFDPSLTIDVRTLGAVRSPTVFLWGTNDVYGGPDVARRAADAMPDADLELMPDAGHLCWLDDVDRAATVVRRHLLGT